MKRGIILVAIPAVAGTAWLMMTAARDQEFTVPDEKQRLAAIGSTDDLTAALRRAFDAAGAFRPIPAPGPSDWLAYTPFLPDREGYAQRLAEGRLEPWEEDLVYIKSWIPPERRIATSAYPNP